METFIDIITVVLCWGGGIFVIWYCIKWGEIVSRPNIHIIKAKEPIRFWFQIALLIFVSFGLGLFQAIKLWNLWF